MGYPYVAKSDFQPVELKAERPSNKQQLKVAAVQAGQSISREETQNLVQFHWLQTLTANGSQVLRTMIPFTI